MKEKNVQVREVIVFIGINFIVKDEYKEKKRAPLEGLLLGFGQVLLAVIFDKHLYKNHWQYIVLSNNLE